MKKKINKTKSHFGCCMFAKDTTLKYTLLKMHVHFTVLFHSLFVSLTRVGTRLVCDSGVCNPCLAWKRSSRPESKHWSKHLSVNLWEWGNICTKICSRIRFFLVTQNLLLRPVCCSCYNAVQISTAGTAWLESGRISVCDSQNDVSEMLREVSVVITSTTWRCKTGWMFGFCFCAAFASQENTPASVKWIDTLKKLTHIIGSKQRWEFPLKKLILIPPAAYRATTASQC